MSEPIVTRVTVADRPAPECDLCHGPDPIWCYPCRAFVMVLQSPEGSRTQDFDSDGWAVCAACAPLVDQADVEGLVARFAANISMAKLGQEELEFMTGLIGTIHGNFLRHRYGPPIRYVPDLS